jgi:Icc-related predicted phosphoesterase
VSSIFGIVGDVHGNFTALRVIVTRHPEVPFWLCVGDVASRSGEYPSLHVPVYFIKGNNENFDALDRRALPDGLHYLPNAQRLVVGGLTVVGVGGTLAPTWYDTPAAALPHPQKRTTRATELADKRRHFVREEIEAARRLTGVDVLLTHEAPSPCWIDLPSATAPGKRWRRDVGKAPITELADALRPRLHAFGHHHVAAAITRNGIDTVCADRVNRTYLLVDRDTFAWRRHAVDAAADA